LGFLGKIDNDGSVAIAKLLRREYLTTQQARDFMRFAAAQMLRVDAYFQRTEAVFSPMFQEMAERAVRHDAAFREALIRDFREIGTSPEEVEKLMASLERGEFKMTASRDFIVTTFLVSLDQAADLFCKMEWSFLRIEGTREVFVTSDNPLVLEDVGEGATKPLGIANPDIEITMPLSPTTVAVARWSGETGYGIIAPDSIAVLNQRTINRATRHVYASYWSDELLAQVVASQGRQARTVIQRIESGGSLIIQHAYQGSR
jgi:hypothetical protein